MEYFLVMDKKNQQEEELVTRKQAAEFFHITLPTLHAWSKQRLIISYEIGGRTYYKRSELLKALRPKEY